MLSRLKEIFYSLKKSKEFQFLGISNISTKIVAGIFWLYLAGVLGTEDYGQVNYLIAIGSLGAAVSMFGTSNTVIVYTAKKIPINSTVYLIAIIIGTISSSIIFVIQNNLIVSLFVFGYIFYNLGIAEILGKKDYKKYSIILIIQKIIFVISGVILVNFIGFEGVVLAFAISMMIFSHVVIKGLISTKIDFKILKPKFGFIMNNYLLTIEKILRSQVDKIIIAPMFGFAILGNFALSIQVLSLMTILPNIVFQYTLSQDASGIKHEWVKKISILSSILFAIAGITLSPIIIPIIFPEYIEAIQLIQITSIQIIPNALIMNFTSKFLGEEKGKIVLIGQCIGVTIYLIGLFTLGTILGINGVAISLVISSSLQAIFYLWSSKTEIK